jgi:hypothetical protein
MIFINIIFITLIIKIPDIVKEVKPLDINFEIGRTWLKRLTPSFCCGYSVILIGMKTRIQSEK